MGRELTISSLHNTGTGGSQTETSVLGQTLTGRGVETATVQTTLEWAEKLDKTFKATGFKSFGTTLGVVSSFESIYTFLTDPSLKSLTDATINVTCSFSGVGGVANGILEVSGVKGKLMKNIFGN